jgi:hypothetical protein
VSGITDEQQALVDRCIEVLSADERILGAWLDGSLGQDAGDEWSDVDVHCYVADDDLPAYDAGWRDLMAAILGTTPVWTHHLGASAFGQVGGAAADTDFRHVDLMVFGRSRAEQRSWDGTVPLFDRGGLLPSGAVPPAPPGEPSFPRQVVEQYLYSLSQQQVVVGRRELVRMYGSIGTFMDVFLLPLLFAERGIDPKGGIKRLNAFLDDEQRALLESMPPITMDLDALTAAQLWIARAGLPRARRLAERIGADYPDDLERAVAAHLQRTLGITLFES